ncbi:vomeronasal type-2 receptor 26-like [Hyperolius riggenbachi]|uniref:vomeronasal type-2 receptor 26-like n=1 Tax=Hyperolius riggenbachi TaxID=752182 RepID=UPI0035A393D2
MAIPALHRSVMANVRRGLEHAVVQQVHVTMASWSSRPSALFYKNFLVFQFAINRFNNDPDFLPNMTLGYHIYDSCNSGNKAMKSALQILSGPGRTSPNYSCTKHKVVGFIGDHFSTTTIPLAHLLSIYGYLQISYGATDSKLNDKHVFPNVFRMLQNDQAIYSFLADILRFFGWTWVGIFASDDESGEKETQTLTGYLTRNGICLEFAIKMSPDLTKSKEKYVYKNIKILEKSSAQVIVFCGTYSIYARNYFNKLNHFLSNRTAILSPSWGLLRLLLNKYLFVFHGSIAFDFGPIKTPNMRNFFNERHPSQDSADKLLEDIWLVYYCCCPAQSRHCHRYAATYSISLRNCTGNEKISDIPEFTYYGLYSRVFAAVFAMAQALNNKQFCLRKYLVKNKLDKKFHAHLHHNLRRLLKENQRNASPMFDHNKELITSYKITNWKNESIDYVGHLDPQMDKVNQLFINTSVITWKTSGSEIPKSQCSENCVPGSRKVLKLGKYHCCYSCVPCPEGEISNSTDSENCLKCDKYETPNESKDTCIPKIEDFLSLTQDSLSIIFISLSICLFFLTTLVFGLFISHQDTPIVKANNKSLSFVLLVSIMLCFLCVFFFLGRPINITCWLRQMTFGIFFTIAVSCVLTKAIMVIIAFKATKPGSAWRNLIGIKMTNCMVFLSSSVQVIICICWSVLSPPFNELDTHSYQNKIIVQCNEGSIISFYSVVGYIGILAVVSFVTAFLVRTLPDSFNEAKCITFSMLVVCSVWIAMIPAYLSTKGKYMVAVEIFAILTSSAGLLVCIFLPKCFIILCRPHLNAKSYLFQKH